MKFEVLRLNSVDWLIVISKDIMDIESKQEMLKAFKNAGLEKVIIINDA